MVYGIKKQDINFMGLRFDKKNIINLTPKAINELNKAKSELKKHADCHKHLDIFITTADRNEKKGINIVITRSKLGKLIDYFKYSDFNFDFYSISGKVPHDESYSTEIIRTLIKTIANFEKMLITRKRIENLIK